MKKIISVMLIIFIIVSLASTTVFADSPKNKASKNVSKNLFAPGLLKKLFDDSDEIQWAQKAIERLALKGLVKGRNGKFEPKSPVTKIEAVVMALRIMGWENEALSRLYLPRNYKGKTVSQWAVGYVAIAYEKGILDDVDMMYFNPNEPVKRHEVAKYVIRALGKEDEAEDHMDKDLPFVDAPAIPRGSIGYVYMVNKLGIMTGDGKRFNPMGTLTRAEMAVLFCNLDDRVDGEQDENEYTGIVQGIDDDEITIRVGNSNKTFDVSDDVLVYEGRTRVRYSSVKKGDRVLLKTEDGEVEYIEILGEDYIDDKIITRYTGKLIEIRNGNPVTITIQIETMKVIFNVASNVEVYFKGVKGTFSQISAGDNITVSVDDRKRAIKIYVDREKVTWDDEVEGVITRIDLSGDYHISIDNKEYDLSRDAYVEIDGEEADLEDLAVGMEAEIEIEDGIVVEISAHEVSSEVKGTIEAVGSKSIKVLVNGKTREYSFANNMDIDVKGYADRLSSLKTGMKVELKLVNNLVTELYAEDNMFEVEGEIEEISVSGSVYKIELEVDGKDYTYEVSGDAEITIEGIGDSDLDDLEEGMEGTFVILNNKIVEIDIED